jgi:hypothetical protein
MTFYDVLGLSIKAGRTAVRTSQTRHYVRTIEDLMQLHGVAMDIGGSFAKKLDAADRARNELAHSLFSRDPEGRLHIQLVSGAWTLGEDVLPVRRTLQPETKRVDRAYLTNKRRTVDDAIKATKHVRSEILRALRSSLERRRTQPDWDRRRPHRTEEEPPPQRRSFEA